MKKKIALIIIALIFAATAGGILLNRANAYRRPHQLADYVRLATDGQWEELLEACHKPPRNLHEANLLNLALAQTGRLAEDLFRYRPLGPYSLINLENENQSNPITALVLFAMGDIAAAEMVAFNASLDENGDRGSMLRILAQAELMRGCYKVADKYLAELEQYKQHRSWASGQRAFLYDDAAVEADPVLSRGRRSLGTDAGRFVLLDGVMADLEAIIDSNPADTLAMQYALSYLMLAKDFVSVREFVERRYGCEALQQLPGPAQEAVLFFSDYFNTMDESYAQGLGIDGETFRRYAAVDLQWCREHGVTDQTIERFSRFKTAYEKNRGTTPDSAMITFKETFWYYLLYTQI